MWEKHLPVSVKIQRDTFPTKDRRRNCRQSATQAVPYENDLVIWVCLNSSGEVGSNRVFGLQERIVEARVKPAPVSTDTLDRHLRIGVEIRKPLIPMLRSTVG